MLLLRTFQLFIVQSHEEVSRRFWMKFVNSKLIKEIYSWRNIFQSADSIAMGIAVEYLIAIIQTEDIEVIIPSSKLVRVEQNHYNSSQKIHHYCVDFILFEWYRHWDIQLAHFEWLRDGLLNIVNNFDKPVTASRKHSIIAKEIQRRYFAD